MLVSIVAREADGQCDLTGKSGEVWHLKAGPRGSVQKVSTARLPEILRVLMAVDAGDPTMSEVDTDE